MAYTTINKSTDHFNTVTYTGNGGTNAITGVGFQPDMVWTKNRSSAQNHLLYDAVRGIGYYLYPNLTNAQGGSGGSGTFNSFDSDGFTLGSGDDSNVNGENGVAWSWKAANSAGSANTDGTINSTVSVNTTAGFSIVKYTGTGSNATVGHGLGAVPKMFIVKRRDGADSWYIFNSNLGSNDAYIVLDSTNASSTSNGNTLWNSTAPTNQVFSLGTNGVVNGSGRTYVAYCFSEKVGYSKFGSYIGNGNADGTFIYTGFKPAFVMVKRTDNTSDWQMQDNKRIGYNINNYRLKANLSDAETTSGVMDFISNGFKFRGTPMNTSGGTFVYMAFAEAPLVGSNNVPCTAR